jgi:hypothetical protein
MSDDDYDVYTAINTMQYAGCREERGDECPAHVPVTWYLPIGEEIHSLALSDDGNAILDDFGKNIDRIVQEFTDRTYAAKFTDSIEGDDMGDCDYLVRFSAEREELKPHLRKIRETMLESRISGNTPSDPAGEFDIITPPDDILNAKHCELLYWNEDTAAVVHETLWGEPSRV